MVNQVNFTQLRLYPVYYVNNIPTDCDIASVILSKHPAVELAMKGLAMKGLAMKGIEYKRRQK